jgi:hypothetical protein
MDKLLTFNAHGTLSLLSRTYKSVKLNIRFNNISCEIIILISLLLIVANKML